jgi:hypothetical protein
MCVNTSSLSIASYVIFTFIVKLTVLAIVQRITEAGRVGACTVVGACGGSTEIVIRCYYGYIRTAPEEVGDVSTDEPLCCVPQNLNDAAILTHEPIG